MKNSNTLSPPTDPILNLKLLAVKTGDLPPIPETALRALQMIRDPLVSVRDLQSVIGQDQALAAKILRIVNSAMYCLSREVSTVSHAIAILGLETIRSIIMAASVQHVFQSGSVSAHDLGTKLLSDHSWGTAICARLLANVTRYANPEEAFVCGLMHDIGKPVMLKTFSSRYTQIVSEVYRGTVCFHGAELESFGFSHAHVGALLADKWNYPPQLSEAIGYHHNPLSAPRHTRLACITNLANLVMVFLGIGFEKNKDLELDKQPAAGFLRLSPKAMDELVVEVRHTVEHMPDAFKF